MYSASKTRLMLIALLLPLCAVLKLQAQNDVIVSTTVSPPYSPYLSDYVDFENKLVVTLINTTNQQLELRLVGSFEGLDNNVLISIPENFQPAQPIVLNAFQTRSLMGAQLQEYFNPDVLSFSGISKAEVVQGNGLPEGNYQLCMRAFDYAAPNPRSLAAPSGCTQFLITHYDPPVITQPLCDSEVAAQKPQNLLLTWTIPAGAPPQNLEYVLQMVEVLPANTDPNQAMLAAPNPPFFEKVVQTNSYLYTGFDPLLEEGMRYAMRVQARSNNQNEPLSFKNNGYSEVCAFVWGAQNDNQDDDQDDNNDEEQQDDEEEQQQQVDLEEEYANPCETLNCAPQPIAQGPAANKNYEIGDEVQIGYFIMTLTDLDNPSASNLTGEGYIDAPVFHTRLKTTFNGLKVNAEHKVYQGAALGAYDPGAQVDQQLQAFNNNLNNIAANKVKQVSDFVKNNQKYVEQFADVEIQGLPFAWSKMVDSKLQLINIAAVEFKPDGARFNAFLNFEIPEAQNDIVAFGQKNVCFHPTGLSVDGLQELTMLGEDKTMQWGPNIDLTLKAVGGQNGGCYVKWDCDGYHEMQLDGFFAFSEDILQHAENDGEVRAEFTFTVGSWGNMLGKIEMDPFIIKGFKGLEMEFDEVWLDFSDTQNPANMSFPANYNGGIGPDWRGFYFKSISVTLPDYLKKGQQPVTISLQDALINKLGFTGKVSVQPVFSLDQGNLGGWSFSMSKFELAFLNNSLTQGKFQGELKLPVAQTGLAYSCLLSNVGQNLHTAFEVQTLNDLNVPMWGAELNIYEGSSISVVSQGNDVTVEAVLSGDLTVDQQFASLKNVAVKIPDVEFQNFKIRNKKPYLSADLFKFASPQKSFAGFPVSIKPEDGIAIKFKDNGTKAGIQLGFHVGLDGNGQSALTGGTSFTIWGKMNEINGKQSWSLDKPELNSIYLKASIAACEIEGEVNLYNGDQKFGDGFRGALTVKFRPLIEVSATVQFGSTNYQNGNTRYRYWYFDAMAKMNVGIMVYPGFGIYGFGGGAYYHMKPVGSMPSAASLAGDPENVNGFNQDQPGLTSTGITYDPAPNIAFGFKASIIMGTMPSPKAFNGDITFEMSFFEGGGINEIAFYGAGYFVSVPDPQNRPGDDAILVATADFRYSGANKTFDGKVSVHFNIKAGNKNIISGGGDAFMHFSANKWFIKVGQPEDPMGLNVLGLLQIDSYFMIGKNSLGDMPDLPTSPINFKAKFPGFNEQFPRLGAVNSGSGFAFGQKFGIDTGKLTFLVFYARIAINFGYDISVLNYDAECDKVDGKMGLNGWYATGQVYAGLEAEVGLKLDFWFARADVELFSVGLYTALAAGLPNPTWLAGEFVGQYSVMNGLLSGSCHFKFRWGDYCNPAAGNPFGGVQVISDLKPLGSEVDVYAFPQATFSLPVGLNKVIQVQILNEDQETEVLTFRFDVRKFEVRRKSNNAKVAGSWSMVEQNMSALFEPNEMLDELTFYKARIEIHGDRKINGQWQRVKACKNCQNDYVESKDIEFKTGKAPENFREQDVISTAPGRWQRYFHWSDFYDGNVRLKQFPTHIANLQPEDNDYKYEYEARFHEVEGGSEKIGSGGLTWKNTGDFKGVEFDIPDLSPQKIYIMQIVRKKVKKGQGQGMQANMNMNFNANQGGGGGGNVGNWTQNRYVGQGNKVKVKRTRVNSLKLGDNEFMVYQLAFRTSKYSMFKNKLDKYINNRVSLETGNGFYSRTLYAKYKGDEALDWYDLNQTWYKKGSVTYYNEPLVYCVADDRSGPATSDTWWSHLYNRYFRYSTRDQYINSVYIATPPLENKLNPLTFRSYPSKNAYLPGSRLTNHTHLSQDDFPERAVDIEYSGTGTAKKLTNAEVNAAYWKGFNPPKPKAPANKGFQANLQEKNGPKKMVIGKINLNGLNNPNMNGPNQIQNLEHNFMTIRFDVMTVLHKDRLLVYDELMRRYGNVLGQTPTFWHFMRYNCPSESTADALGVNGWNYWSMNPLNSAKYTLRIQYPRAMLGKEVWLQLGN